MSMNKHIAWAALCACAAFFAAAPVGPAQAQGLLERLFGSPTYQDRSYRSHGRDGRWRSYRNEAALDGSGGYSRRSFGYGDDPEPAKVKSPRYYTYRPDGLKMTSFAGLAEVKTASATPLEAVGDPFSFAEARAHLATFSMRVLPEVGEAIKAHYEKAPKFLWVEQGRVNARAHAALAALDDAGRYALAPADYKVSVPADATDAADVDAAMKALAEFEIALSAKALTYVLDATRGRIDPNRISGYHDFDRKKVDLAGTLQAISQASDAGAYLENANPDNKPFKALVAELAALQEAGPIERVEVAAGTFIRPGGRHPEMANVVAALHIAASDALKQEHAATFDNYADGKEYTPELVVLVRAFQAEKGLKPDGVVGRNTLRAMQPQTAGDKREKVKLAMERLRWLPRDLGQRHVMINQPAFTATYMEEGRDPLSMRVVVGTKSNQTSFFMDRIETVEFNPYWGVPQSIIINEMIPQLRQDPSYLDRLGYEITTASGRRVSSYQVDWYAVASKQASINVRQPPGGDNALGLVKILFPNKHAIYMHDTPHKSLFQKDERAFSHGCVRLQDPRAMAAAVLGKPVSYVDGRIGEGHNDQDKVVADIPVYVSYFTAWPTADGAVEYFDDMYERDMYLARAISATDAARAGS